MKKFLKFLLYLVSALVAAYILLVLTPAWYKRANLRKDGYTKEEVRLFERIDYYQSTVDRAVGKEAVKVQEWGHLTEVYDVDGATLLGYSIDAKLPTPYLSKRYFFTKDKELLWWGNVSDSIDDEGREHLRTGKGY